jgi:hypothetical protein
LRLNRQAACPTNIPGNSIFQSAGNNIQHNKLSLNPTGMNARKISRILRRWGLTKRGSSARIVGNGQV